MTKFIIIEMSFRFLLHYKKHYHHIYTEMHDGFIVTCDQIFPFIFGLKKGSGYLTIDILCCRIHRYCGVLITNDKPKEGVGDPQGTDTCALLGLSLWIISTSFSAYHQLSTCHIHSQTFLFRMWKNGVWNTEQQLLVPAPTDFWEF